MDAEPTFRGTLSVEDYLEYEDCQQIRHEYIAGYLYAMVGASRRHNLIITNIQTRLALNAEATGCQVFSQGMKLRTDIDIFFYPDIMVVCDPADDNDLYVERPCLLVEVLSASTASRDRREKLIAYRQIPTLKAYLIIHQDDFRIERHWRDAAGDWQQADHIGQNGEISIPCPTEDTKLQVAEIYAGLPPLTD